MGGEPKKEEQKFCPKIEPVNNNMADLPYEERMSIVEIEVQSLYEFCCEKRFSNKEITNCVKNLYGPEKSVAKRVVDDSKRTFFILSGIIALISVLLMQEKMWNLAIVHAKLFSVKVVMPYWDWSQYYEEDCLVTNHWLPEKVTNVTADECKYCEKFDIERVSNINHTFLTEIITNGDQEPFIITDTTKEWKNIKKLTMDEIKQIYQHHPALSNTLGSCPFQNTAGFNDMFYDFINAYDEKKLPQTWHSAWVNCDAKAAKVIRSYHPRPYFLPLMMQLKQDNAVITALGMTDNGTFTLPTVGDGRQKSQGKWVTVISGALKFTLNPIPDCVDKFSCVNNTFVLKAGQTLFFLDEPWEPFYTPADAGITIAITNDVVWDEMS